MQKLATTAEAALNGIATNSTKSQNEMSQKTGLPITWTVAIFKRFHVRYGHKWVSAIDGIEETAISEWSQRLAGLTGDQIKRGLDIWSGEWPPSADEFRAACLGKKLGLNGFGLDYVPEYYRQAPVVDRSKQLSSDERDARRATAGEKISALRDALKK